MPLQCRQPFSKHAADASLSHVHCCTSDAPKHPAGINGIGLSMVVPSGQSMVADYYPEESRGAAFGALYLTGAVGAMLGALQMPHQALPHSNVLKQNGTVMLVPSTLL